MWLAFFLGSLHLGVFMGQVERVEENIINQFTSGELRRFQFAVNPSFYKYGSLVENLNSFNSTG